MALDKDLLDILVCPKCKGTLTLSDDEESLTCYECKLIYHVKDEIPIMLIDEATPLE